MQNSTTANSQKMTNNEKELVVFDRARFLMTPIWENLFKTFTDEKGYTLRYVTQDPNKVYEDSMCEEMAKAEDMGDFYRVPADNRDLNYDKYFKDGDTKMATIEEFNSDNTRRLNLEETKAKIASLEYIQNELNGVPNLV